MRHAVIMAGGAGTRLWPLSRQERPKQVLKLFSGKSLLRESFDRLASFLPPESIYVITGAAHLPMVAETLPEMPAANLFGEPVGRDTANAVGLAAAILDARDPEAVMGIFTADHIIRPLDRFREAVERSFDTAEEHADALVTMGITPTRPDTGFGYVQRGEQLAPDVYVVKQFTEKPDADTARKYVDSGEYYWNSGMFAWRAKTVLSQLENHLPAAHGPLVELGRIWDTDQRAAQLERVYKDLPKISIDFAVMEKADRVLMGPMECEWIDVGSFPAISGVVDADSAGNVNAVSESVNLDSKGNILVSEEKHLIATIGCEDLVIVHAPDATLVCPRDQAARIKELVAELQNRFGERYT